jgi:[protein-PII] uridylyltransferase
MIDAEPAPDQPQPARPGQPKPGPWRIADIVDGRKLRIQLTAAALDNGSDPIAQRKRALDLIHAALFRGRMIAQERLEEGADGLDTAGLLSAVMDEALSALYDFTVVHVFRAHNPTEAERMAVVAVGGYGRSVLAPSSDVDILFVRNYKQTAWAESVIEYMLYALWDIGLKVGHSFRTIDECVKLSKEDVTIRTSILDKRFLFGDRGVYDKLVERFQKDVIQGRGAEFVAAKLQERARPSRARGRLALSRRTECEGRQGRPARSADAVLAREIHSRRQDAYRKCSTTPPSRRPTRRSSCAKRASSGRCAAICIFSLAVARSVSPSTCSPRWRRAWAIPARQNVNAVERFMKRYFLAAKEVGALTRILCAKLEVDEKKRPGGRPRFLGGALPRSRSRSRALRWMAAV